CKGSEPSLINTSQRQREHKTRGQRAFGRDIRQIHAQRFARDGVRGIVRQEMHALDDGIGGHDDILAARLEDRGIIIERKRPRIGRERLEIARDQRVLTGWPFIFARHALYPLVIASDRNDGICGYPRPNSSPRNWRAIWSSTAFTMPVSSRWANAWATSTYSERTTRPGTSLRCSSS